MACSMKCTVWTYWFINTIFSSAYGAVALATFINLQQLSGRLDGDYAAKTRTMRSGLLAACMLGFIIVMFWIILSALVLFSRLFGEVKLFYGIMLGTQLHTAWFQLLAGLVLNTAKDWVQFYRDNDVFSSTKYNTYQATYGLSYFLVGLYLIGFIILLLARKYIGRQKEQELAPASDRYADMGKTQPSIRMSQV